MADTVALMKQRVLDMAIRGELVEQRPEEGTAEELNKKFQSVGKKKMSKIEIDKNEKPFDLPSSWMWVRLNEVGEIIGGGTPKTKVDEYWDNGTVPWISPADLTGYKKKYISKGRKNITELGLKKSSARLMPKGTVLFSSRAPIGYVAISSNEIATNQGFKSVVPYILDTNEYIYYYFQAFLDNIKDRSSGTTFKEISGSELGKSVFPLPPLQEQRRIVAKIEEIFAVIDQIGTKKEEALSIIRNMRQTALQDAIMGVLVDQDENDEPASVLYEKIQAEKERMIQAGEIKRGKPLPEIEENEIPYEVPKNWGWTRLGDLGFYKKGPFGSALTKSIFVEDSLESIKVYEQKNAIQSDWTLGEYFITKKYYEEKMTSNTVIPGDIIISCAGTIGKSYIIPDNARLGIINQALMRVRVYTINKQYFRLIFNHVIQTDGAQGKGSAIKNIPPMKVLNNLLVPLPPLAEQDRIIEKIDTIMAICDQMEAILNGTTEANEALKISE